LFFADAVVFSGLVFEQKRVRLFSALLKVPIPEKLSKHKYVDFAAAIVATIENLYRSRQSLYNSLVKSPVIKDYQDRALELARADARRQLLQELQSHLDDLATLKVFATGATKKILERIRAVSTLVPNENPGHRPVTMIPKSLSLQSKAFIIDRVQSSLAGANVPIEAPPDGFWPTLVKQLRNESAHLPKDLKRLLQRTDLGSLLKLVVIEGPEFYRHRSDLENAIKTFLSERQMEVTALSADDWDAIMPMVPSLRVALRMEWNGVASAF
jgi:hypothetical protein